MAINTTKPAGEPIKLLLADVDGTLVTQQKVLTDQAKAAVFKLHDAGIAFAITSGRPPRGMAMLIEPLKITTAIAGFNGGLMVKPDLSIIDAKPLPREVTSAAVKLIVDHQLDAWIYRGNDWYVHDRHAPHVDREQWTVKFDPQVVPNFDNLLDEVVKIVGISDDLDKVAKAEKDAQQQFGKSASAARSQPYYLDITHPQANKGAVVERLSQELKIPTAQIATIGDMPNDQLMFRLSGISIAMGNASKEVQASATFSTDSNESEGFAKAVDRLLREYNG